MLSVDPTIPNDLVVGVWLEGWGAGHAPIQPMYTLGIYPGAYWLTHMLSLGAAFFMI